jgi:hypothetical protein
MRRWDLKYYHQIHCNKQKALWNHPVSYSNFVNRLRDWMNLHDAIYTPRAEWKVRHANKTPIQDAIRRKQINKEENIQILDLDYLMELEMKNQIKMPKPKKSLRVRFLDFFKRKH